MDDRLSLREEIACALTHGIGAAAGLAGAGVLITIAALVGDGWQIVGAVVFGIALVLLYTASTLYHAIPHETAKARLRVFDHCAIFVLIAGTYTPFTLALRGRWGWMLFGIVWGLAAVGIALKLFTTGKFNRLSTLIYVAMGWLIVVGGKPVLGALPASTLVWLVAGGVTYTAGVAFYLSRRRYAHAVWHLFVLGGSVCHFAAVLTQLLATGA